MDKIKKITPSVPKGTRDFSPNKVWKKDYVINKIKTVFQTHGFNPIETPSMEKLDVLLGKYGDEGDKLLYKVTDTSKSSSNKDFSLGLRYDLTVPLARYVAQHQNDIVFPFKRYQIQPVWRADNPQKGRYREFCQCDVDIIGDNSLTNELALLDIIVEVFFSLNLSISIEFNNRKVLYGIMEVIGIVDKFTEVTTIIDKIDKIGLNEVKSLLVKEGLNDKQIDQLVSIITMNLSNTEKITFLKVLLQTSEIGLKGVEEIEYIVTMYDKLYTYGKQPLNVNFSLCRGLNYYTGSIFEVKSRDNDMGSICGGGRYDNLTSLFGLENMSGVGVSFGLDRILNVMGENSNPYMFSDAEPIPIMCIVVGDENLPYAQSFVNELRRLEYVIDMVVTTPQKYKKELQRANRLEIPTVLSIGSNEVQQAMVTVNWDERCSIEKGIYSWLTLSKMIKERL